MDSKKSNTSELLGDASFLYRGQLDNVTKVTTGGMSEIYRAFQPAMNRYIVIKKLKKALKDNQEIRERFRREAKSLSSVHHQNVAHAYDFVETNDDAYLFMEYIDGLDVSTLIRKMGALPPTIATTILIGVAKGVSAIHHRRLIHRDIKPSNIRINTKGEVKLMDFGIIFETDGQSLTRPGVMVGSPHYLSPEQVLGETLTPRSDLFLLGICFYEMLTGTRPFDDSGNQTVFQNIREANPIPAHRMRANLPRKLTRIIDRCLKKNPKDRYPSVNDLLVDLESYLGSRRNNRREDILLKYLDAEALIDPAVPYADVSTDKPRLVNLAAPWIVGALGLLGTACAWYFLYASLYL